MRDQVSAPADNRAVSPDSVQATTLSEKQAFIEKHWGEFVDWAQKALDAGRWAGHDVLDGIQTEYREMQDALGLTPCSQCGTRLSLAHRDMPKCYCGRPRSPESPVSPTPDKALPIVDVASYGALPLPENADGANAWALEVLCRVFDDGADERYQRWLAFYESSKWLHPSRALGAFIRSELDAGERAEALKALPEDGLYLRVCAGCGAITGGGGAPVEKPGFINVRIVGDRCPPLRPCTCAADAPSCP